MRIQKFGICLLVLLYSCNSSGKEDVSPKTRDFDTAFTADRFEDRSDTARFFIDKGDLKGKPQILKVQYRAISCTCAQWSEVENSSATEYPTGFFLEPGDSSLVIADNLFEGDNFPVQVTVIGQFYAKEGYPKGYRPDKGDPIPAKVFRYTRIVIDSLGSSL